MAPRRRRRRPWYRTRAYRLTRTALLTVVLVTVGVRCTGDDRSTAPYGPDGPYSVAAAGPEAEGAGGGGARPRMPRGQPVRTPTWPVGRAPRGAVGRTSTYPVGRMSRGAVDRPLP